MFTSPEGTRVSFAADLRRHGDQLAVLADGERLSYAELAEHVDTVARRLGRVRRLVLIEGANDLPSLVAYLAALVGGHPTLLTPAGAHHAAASLVAAYDPDVVLRGGSGSDAPLPMVHERRPGTRHDLHPDLAVLLSTSGSTGSPKLVRLSRANIESNAEAIAETLGIRSEDRAATTLPMHYCYGLSVINSHLVRGAALVLTGLSVVDPCFWALARTNRVTTFAGVPYTFELLDRVGFDELVLPDLRYVTQAGGRLAPDLVRRYSRLGRRRGWDLVVMYGQTEATARMAYLPADRAEASPEAIGLPIPGGALRIEPVPGLADGELVYSGPNVMLGYAETPADLSLGRTVDELRTGDLARLRADGLFELVGRRGRFIKVVGLRIDLDRVEAILADDGITAAATGTDEALVVVVEGDRAPTLAAKVLAADLGLPGAAIHLRAVERVPRLSCGKLDYEGVAALLGGSDGGAEHMATAHDAPPHARRGRSDGPRHVRRIFAEQLDLAEVDDDATFVSLGGDSLSYVATSLRLEETLGHLPADWHVTPIGALARRTPSPGGRLSRLMPGIETSIVLRAVAIVLIVGTHARLVHAPGTAHVLIAVAGFNFARFQLSGEGLPRMRRQLRSLSRIVLPSVAFIGAAALATGSYSLANVALLNAVVGPATWSTHWHFWFIEVLVYVLVAMVAMLAVPAVSRLERAFPFSFPLTLLGIGLLSRFELVDLGLLHTRPVFWLFALGWAIAAATSAWQRAAMSAAIALTVPGFFGDPYRDGLIAIGIALLVWLPAVPFPAPLHRVAGLLATSSLYTYLTHWLVYPPLTAIHPALGVAGSLAVGVAYLCFSTRLPVAVRRGLSRLHAGASAKPAAARASSRHGLHRAPRGHGPVRLPEPERR